MRVILATASVHSARAHQLGQAGIEVIEPEEPDAPLEVTAPPVAQCAFVRGARLAACGRKVPEITHLTGMK